MPFSVRVVLAVYRPDPDHFETQIRSLAAQTHPPERVYLVIADRSSGPLAERLAGAAGLACALVEPDSDLDAVRAFEAGLAAALEDADDDTLIAACDQDDLWHPDRLAAGIEALEKTGADIVHSDARLVDGTGATALAATTAAAATAAAPTEVFCAPDVLCSVSQCCESTATLVMMC